MYLFAFIYLPDMSRLYDSLINPLPTGLNLKILLVNLETLKVALPVAMRAEQSWTVLQLKEAVSEVR